MQFNDPVERATGVLTLLKALEADEFQSVITDFRALGITEQRLSEYGLILHQWAKVAPAEALDYALENTDEYAIKDFARQTIMASWAVEDLDAAVAAAREKHEGEGPIRMLVGIVNGIRKDNPTAAKNLLEEYFNFPPAGSEATP